MPQDPSENMRKAAREADRLRAQIERQIDQAALNFIDRTAEMQRMFGSDVRQMVKDFRAFATDTSAAGTHFFHKLKDSLRGMATFFPEEFRKAGISVDEIFAETAAGATRVSEAHISATAARFGRIRDILAKAGVDETELDARTYEVFEKNLEGHVAYVQEYMQDRLMMARGNEAEQVRIVQEAQKKILSAVSGRVQAQTKLEEKLVGAAQSRVPTHATDALMNKGLLGELARGLGGDKLKGLATSETQSLLATGKAGGTVVNTLTRMEGIVQTGIGAFSKLSTAVMPAVASLGFVALALKELFTWFDRVKRQGAAMTEVMAVQGKVGSAGILDVAAAGAELGVRLRDAKMATLGTAVEWDVMTGKALELGKGMGGLGSSASAVVAGLAQIGVAAPAAGMSAEQAMGMVAKGQRVFGMSNEKQVRHFFDTIRISARSAGLSVQEFLEATGGIDDIGTMWGDSADKIASAAAAMAKAGASLPAALRSTMVGAFTSLGRMPLSQTLALQQFAHGGSTAQAGQRIQGAMGGPGGILGSNIEALRKAMSDRGLFGQDKRVQLGLFLEKSPFGQMQGLSRLLFSEQKTANQVLKSLQRGSQKDLMEVQAAINKAAIEEDPLKLGADLASKQLDTLKQLQITVSEGLQTIISYLDRGLLGLLRGGSNPADMAAARALGAIVNAPVPGTR